MTLPEFPQLDGVEHRFLDLPGLRMHVAEAGAGEPLLLLHGFPQHWWGWYKVLPALAQRYRVIAPDLRGAGIDAQRRRVAGARARSCSRTCHPELGSEIRPRNVFGLVRRHRAHHLLSAEAVDHRQ